MNVWSMAACADADSKVKCAACPTSWRWPTFSQMTRVSSCIGTAIDDSTINIILALLLLLLFRHLCIMLCRVSGIHNGSSYQQWWFNDTVQSESEVRLMKLWLHVLDTNSINGRVPPKSISVARSSWTTYWTWWRPKTGLRARFWHFFVACRCPLFDEKAWQPCAPYYYTHWRRNEF